MDRPNASEEIRTGGGELPAPGKPGFFEKLRGKVNRQLVDWLAKNAVLGGGAIVLEAGSGPADGASLIAATPGVGLSVALDLSMENLRTARQRDPKLVLIRGDLFRLPFKPGVFDLVWNNSTLEHINEKRRVIYEMVHVTKSGGRIFVGLPYTRGPLMIQPWIANTRLGKKIGHLFDEQSLAIDLEGTGITIEKFTTFFYKAFFGCLARKG